MVCTFVPALLCISDTSMITYIVWEYTICAGDRDGEAWDKLIMDQYIMYVNDLERGT